MDGTEPNYPIVIRVPVSTRLAQLAYFLILAGLCGFLSAQPLAAHPGDPAIIYIRVGLASLALGFLIGACNVALSRVILQKDSIAKAGLFGRRELRRDQIEGVRLTENQRFRIVPSDPGAKPIAFSTKLLKNEALLDWLDDVRSLDDEETEAALKDYEQDPRYGATVEERHARLVWMGRLATAGMWLSFAVAAWLLLWPKPYLLAVAVDAALPLIAFAFALGSRGLVRFGLGKGGDIKASVQTMIVAPGMALLFRAIGDVHLLDWPLALEWAVAGALAVTVLLVTMSGGWRRVAWGYVFLVSGSLLFYGCGVVAYGDVSLDTAQPAHFQTLVVGKHSEWSRGGRRYYLTVEPWGPSSKRDDFRVPESVYQRENAGDLVCPVLGGGRLGLRWYVFEPCQP